MNSPEFNPFNKPLSSITSGDIYQLDDQEEGYYIDYKRDLIDGDALAKGISSFANTYGGILFLGIDEDDENNTPGSYFELSVDPLEAKEKVRSKVVPQVSPVPQFTSYSIEDHSGLVLAIAVPESNRAPHITNNGKIYRRTGEQSNPYAPVENIQFIDNLYERRQRRQNRIEDFCTHEPSDEPSRPILELFGVPSTLDEGVCAGAVRELDRFEEILRERAFQVTLPDSSGSVIQKSGRDRSLTFQSYRTTSNGIIGQAWLGRVSPNLNPTMFQFTSDGGLKLYLPLPKRDFESSIKATIEDKVRAREHHLTPINASRFLRQFYRLFERYTTLLDEYNWLNEPFHRLDFKARFRNLQGTALVFDYSEYQDFIDAYGLPINYEQLVDVPSYDTIQVTAEDIQSDTSTTAYSLSTRLMEGLGLFPNRFETIMEGDNYPAKVFH